MVDTTRPLLPVSTRFRLGSAMIWIGVLAWVPFILLWVNGANPPLVWFLPFHLLGVIGGARLRASADKTAGFERSQRSLMSTAGRLLIAGGVLVWLPYLYMKLIVSRPVDVLHYLPFHLTGVLGGSALLIASSIRNRSES